MSNILFSIKLKQIVQANIDAKGIVNYVVKAKWRRSKCFFI